MRIFTRTVLAVSGIGYFVMGAAVLLTNWMPEPDTIAIAALMSAGSLLINTSRP